MSAVALQELARKIATQSLPGIAQQPAQAGDGVKWQHKSHPYSISSGPPVWLTNTESRSAGTAPGHIQTGSNDAWGQPSQAPGIASVSGTRAVQSTKLARRSPTEVQSGQSSASDSHTPTLPANTGSASGKALEARKGGKGGGGGKSSKVRVPDVPPLDPKDWWKIFLGVGSAVYCFLELCRCRHCRKQFNNRETRLYKLANAQQALQGHGWWAVAALPEYRRREYEATVANLKNGHPSDAYETWPQYYRNLKTITRQYSRALGVTCCLPTIRTKMCKLRKPNDESAV